MYSTIMGTLTSFLSIKSRTLYIQHIEHFPFEMETHREKSTSNGQNIYVAVQVKITL